METLEKASIEELYLFSCGTVFGIKCKKTVQYAKGQRVYMRKFVSEWNWRFSPHIAEISPCLFITNLQQHKTLIIITGNRKLIQSWSSNVITLVFSYFCGPHLCELSLPINIYSTQVSLNYLPQNRGWKVLVNK